MTIRCLLASLLLFGMSIDLRGATPDLPGAYFRLLKAGAAMVRQRLAAEPGADLAALESRDGWRHFPYAILAPSVLYARRHPQNARYHDAEMLSLAIKIGDLLAGEMKRGIARKGNVSMPE